MIGAKTVLESAVRSKRKEIVKILLDSKADVNAKNDAGTTALIAAIYSTPEIFKMLIDANADVNATDNRGGTALEYATKNNKWDIVDMLKSAGAKYFLYY